MIELNRNHPDFDIVGEVMCVLTKLPITHDIDIIAEDLGITRITLNDAIAKIRKNYRVTAIPGIDDMAVGVPELSFERMWEAGQMYWEQVYGYGRNTEAKEQS